MIVGALLFAAGVSTHGGIREETCKYLTSEDGKTVMHSEGGLQVLPLSDSEDGFAFDLPEGAKVMCLRTRMEPAPGDWKVPAAGHKLYLVEDVAQGRTAVLELNEGAFRFRVLKGMLDERETARVEARLAAFGERLAAAGQ